MKLGGWGSSKISLSLSDYPGVLTYLTQHFSVTHLKSFEEFSPEDFSLSPPEREEELKEILKTSSLTYSCESLIRLRYGLGKSYPELLSFFSPKKVAIGTLPCAVLFPKTQEEVQQCVLLAQKHNACLVPFGGGSSVVGGLRAIRKIPHQWIWTISLEYLNRILQVDEENFQVHVEAGIFGPVLESTLQSLSFTFGHFPQSFEFSTVGGWIATLSSGQNSIRYGGIEKRVSGLHLVTGTGEKITTSISSSPWPRQATGPDLKQLFIGSEGRFGIITQACLKISPCPIQKTYKAFAFASWQEGLKACLALVKKKIPLALLRLSDEQETMAHLLLGKNTHHSQSFLQDIFSKGVKQGIKLALSYKNINPQSFSLVLVGMEDLFLWEEVEEEWRKNHCSFLSLGESVGNKWLESRFKLPYFREQLMANDFLVDTLETACSWTQVSQLYEGMKQSLTQSLNNFYTLSHPQIWVHFSHFYEEGVSLYFTIVAKQHPDFPYEQWAKMKEAANNFLKQQKAPASHHHAIGLDHKNAQNIFPWQQETLEQIAHLYDPQGLLNPEKLL